MNRRKLISQSITCASGLYILGQALPMSALAMNKSKNVLVYVFLRGGADVLSLFQMTKGSEFNKLKKLRKTYKASSNQLNIQGSDIKLHQELKFIQTLLATKKAHIVLGTGSLNETRSHFNQQDYIESGSATSVLNKGFLTNMLNLVSKNEIGISVGSSLNLSLLGTPNSKKIIGESDLKVLQNSKQGQSHKDFVATMLGMYRNRFLTHYNADRKLTSVSTKIKPLTDADLSAYAVFKKINDNKISLIDKTAMALLASNESPLILTTNLGGWDTHFDAANRIQKLAEDLDTHIKNIFDSLGEGTNAKVVVMSEFGRTLETNGSSGFDHGRGSAMLLFSNKPTFSQPVSGKYVLDSREIKVVEDFRRPLAQILSDWSGKSTNEIAKNVFDRYQHKNYKL